MQTMILSSTSKVPARGEREDALVVMTLLDAIMRLETRTAIEAIVLTGAYAVDPELAQALGEIYPAVRVEREV